MKKTCFAAAWAMGVLFATNSFAANVWANYVTVNSIASLPDGGFILIVPGGTDSACGNSGNAMYVRANQNGQTADGVRTSLALMILAHTTSKSVNVLYNNATSECYVQTVQINP